MVLSPFLLSHATTGQKMGQHLLLLSSILLKHDISHARILHAHVLVQSLQTNSVYHIKWKKLNKRLQHVFCQQKGSI